MIRELCEGGYVIAGSTGPENIAPLHQAVLMKTSPGGDIIWSKEYGVDGNETAHAVVQNSDGGFTAAGYQTEDGSTNQNIYLFRTDLEGNVLWERNFGGSGREDAYSLTGTSDGGFLTAGMTNTSGYGKTDAYVVKFSSAGVPVWDYEFGNAFDNYAAAVTQIPGGDFLIAGRTKFSDNQPWNDSENDAWYFRINGNGGLVYNKVIGGSQADVLTCVKVVNKKYAVAAGYTKSSSPGKTLAYLVKFNIASGDTVWTIAYGKTGTEFINSIDITPDGNYLLTGSNGDSYEKTEAIFISMVSPGGELMWMKNITRPGANITGHYGIASSTGGYVLTGESYYETFPENRPDIYFMKTDDDVSLVSVPEISGDSLFCEGGKASLQASEIRVGSGITYTWSNSLTGRTIQVNQGGSYTVTATDIMGNKKTSNAYAVREIPSPQVSVTTEGDPRICFGTTLDMKAVISNWQPGTGYEYLWNTGETDSVLTADSEGKYTVVVTDGTYGCTGSSSPLSVEVQKPFNDESICIVTVDPESSKNMIVYSKTPDKGTKAFIIWKETTVAYVYEPIGAVPYSDANLYIDYASSPSTQADRYRISVLDVCDNQSLKSNPHKTMHLTVNAGGGGLNANNLIWDNYEGFPFGTYTIYRGTSPDKLDSIHSIQSSLTSWTDDSPTEGDLYYQVGVRKINPCYIVTDKKASGGGPYAHSLSNLEDNKLKTGVTQQNFHAKDLLVYPNPYSGYTNIIYSVEKRSFVDVSVFNTLGQKVTTLVSDYQAPSDYRYRFSAQDYNQPGGVYLIRVQVGNQVVTRIVMENRGSQP